ncbi:MAG: S8 family serine peptidase [Clostridiaceae bacterium]|nr:S8 family serine peptidase [Clostridiaceae bacterium]
MKKFCPNCGLRLDEKTKLCLDCDAEELSNLSEPESSGTYYEYHYQPSFQNNENQAPHPNLPPIPNNQQTKKRSTSSVGKNIGYFFLTFFLTIFILLGIVTGLVYFEIVDIPVVADILGFNSSSYEIKKDIPPTDLEGIVYYESSEANFVREEGIDFVNNEVLVVLESTSDRPKLEEYLVEYDANIVGELTKIAEYQILFDDTYSYNEISSLVDELEQFSWVVYASPNYVMELETNYFPNDSEWKKLWEDVPDDENWGMEAIEAPAAWGHRDKFQSVNIGIMDGMFDDRHEDLVFMEQPLQNELAPGITSDQDTNQDTDLEWSDHGTHVAGIVAATFDNEIGVTGVSPKTNLYGVSFLGRLTTTQDHNVFLWHLIGEKECSVINVSMSMHDLEFNASRGCKVALKNLDIFSNALANFLQRIMDQGYEFVICAAAGNQNATDSPHKYYLKNDYDEESEYMYYSSEDYEAYKKGEADEKTRQYFERYKDDLDKPISEDGRLDAGNVDTSHNLFAAINKKDVKDRIIIVGAVENLGTRKEGAILGFIGGNKVHNGYEIAPFSQSGERVDILAPGVSIQSTIRGGYGIKQGTSMATPHVTGIAGLVLSANPDLSGAEVKNIIIESGVDFDGGEGFKIANAKNAVEAAFEYTKETTEEDADANEESEQDADNSKESEQDADNSKESEQDADNSKESEQDADNSKESSINKSQEPTVEDDLQVGEQNSTDLLQNYVGDYRSIDGAGYANNSLELTPTNRLRGHYALYTYDDSSPNYPDGTTKITLYEVKMEELEQLDEGIIKAKIADVMSRGPVGEEVILYETRRIYKDINKDPLGFIQPGDEIYFYPPGAWPAELAEWVSWKRPDVWKDGQISIIHLPRSGISFPQIIDD